MMMTISKPSSRTLATLSLVATGACGALSGLTLVQGSLNQFDGAETASDCSSTGAEFAEQLTANTAGTTRKRTSTKNAILANEPSAKSPQGASPVKTTSRKSVGFSGATPSYMRGTTATNLKDAQDTVGGQSKTLRQMANKSFTMNAVIDGRRSGRSPPQNKSKKDNLKAMQLKAFLKSSSANFTLPTIVKSHEVSAVDRQRVLREAARDAGVSAGATAAHRAQLMEQAAVDGGLAPRKRRPSTGDRKMELANGTLKSALAAIKKPEPLKRPVPSGFIPVLRTGKGKICQIVFRDKDMMAAKFAAVDGL